MKQVLIERGLWKDGLNADCQLCKDKINDENRVDYDSHHTPDRKKLLGITPHDTYSTPSWPTRDDEWIIEKKWQLSVRLANRLQNPDYYCIDKDNIEYIIRVTECEKYKANSWTNSSSSLMKSLFLYRLRLIQYRFLISISPLLVKDWSIWSRMFSFKKDYIASTIALLASSPFHLSCSLSSNIPDLTIADGHTPLYEATYLFTLVSKKGKITPHEWYKDIQYQVTVPDSSNLLLPQYDCEAIPLNIDLTPVLGTSQHTMNWIVTTDDDSFPIFGKQLKQQSQTCTIVHWTSGCVASPGNIITLRPCTGCTLHKPVSLAKRNKTDVDPLCIIPKICLSKTLILPTNNARIRHNTTAITSQLTWADIEDSVCR
ncbi:hypothetical protein C1646_763910 [Rhizophagus diaphanus]|nr:hypothetical protein C1646_763910 [Rhizophagus diaphanus] [Rhizophagus sp. MUCL 43196]